MSRSRIRVRNPGRLAAAVAGGGALLILLPGLLEQPEPPPLPDDVGLEAAATGSVGQAPAVERTPPPRSHERRWPAQGSPTGKDLRAERPDRRRKTGAPGAGRRGEDSGGAAPQEGDGGLPATAPLREPPQSANSHRPSPPPRAPAAPSPGPSPATPPPAPPPRQAGGDAEATGPSEFGFER